LPEKVTWEDTYKQVEKKIGSGVEKHPKVRYLEIGETKHLGYKARAQFLFNKNTDLLREVSVFFDENQDAMEKVLTKKYGDPQERSDLGSFCLITWIYNDTEITLGGLGSYSSYVRYTKIN